jgi:anti-sigma B factor antagonist
MPNGLLRVEVSQDRDGATVIRCAGEIDVSNVSDVREALAWSMTADLRALRVDATKVSFVDSNGVRCLIQAAKACSDVGARFEIVPSGQVARTLNLYCLRAAVERPVVWASDGEVVAHRL